MVRQSSGLLFILVLAGFAQQTTQPATSPSASARKVPATIDALGKPVRMSNLPALPEGMPIKLRLTKTVNPRDVKPGDEVPFALAMDLYHRDLLLAKEGTEVVGLVREAHGNGMFGEGSRLTLTIKMLSMLGGQELPLRGKASARGGSDPQSDKYAGEAFGASGWNPPMGIALGVFWLAMPGENVKLPKDTLIIAKVDRETTIDVNALRPFQPARAAGAKAEVRVVRGWVGAAFGADFYCNGIPIAHLPYKRLLELSLEQGWYRFSIKPNKPPLQVYLVAGETYNLSADFRSVTMIPLTEANENTTSFKPFGKQRDFAGLMHDAKPIASSDLYGTSCSPLQEELVPAGTQAVEAPPAQSK